MFVPTPYYRRILYLSAVRFIAPYGRTQADLVDLLAQEGIEVTTKAVSKWENQTREPSLHTILTVCQILDIEDIYEAFLGENPFDHVMKNLNEDRKAKIIEFANLLRESRKYLPHRADIIPFENYQPIAEQICWLTGQE